MEKPTPCAIAAMRRDCQAIRLTELEYIF